MNQTNQSPSEQYRVRFIGEMLPGFAKESAIVNIAKSYNVEPDEIAKWFVDGGVTLRESAVLEEVQTLEGFFSQHGLKLEVTKVEMESSTVNDEAGRPETKQDTQYSAISTQNFAESTQENVSTTASLSDEEKLKQSSEALNDAQKQHDISLQELQDTLSQLKVMLLHKDLEGFVPASLVKRFGAFVIDFLIFVLAFQLIAVNLLAGLGLINMEFIEQYIAIFNSSNGSLEAMMANPDIQSLSMQIIKSLGPWYAIFYFLYFALQERYYGATIGKRLFKIRIFSLRTGKTLTWNTITIRTITFFLGFQVVSSLPLIGIFLFLGSVLWALKDPIYRRNLYDIIAGTVVGSTSNNK